jgi:hypothetical protein
MLYILMVTFLVIRIELDWVNGFLPMVKIIKGYKVINHSQLPIDTLLFGGASIIIDQRSKYSQDNYLAAYG